MIKDNTSIPLMLIFQIRFSRNRSNGIKSHKANSLVAIAMANERIKHRSFFYVAVYTGQRKRD